MQSLAEQAYQSRQPSPRGSPRGREYTHLWPSKGSIHTLSTKPSLSSDEVDLTPIALPDPFTDSKDELQPTIFRKTSTLKDNDAQSTNASRASSMIRAPDNTPAKIANMNPPTTSSRDRSPPRGDETPQSFIRRTFAGTGSRLFRRGSSSDTSLSPESSRSGQFSRAITFGRRSKETSAASSPLLQAMLRRETIPDLQLVNRALEELNTQPDGGPNRASDVESLEKLAFRVRTATAGTKKLLHQAMQDRNNGRYEICRAKCVEITRSQHAEVSTKIYAYNILSTEASLGQGQNYLNLSRKLVEEHMANDFESERLLGIIAGLEKSNEARELRMRNASGRQRVTCRAASPVSKIANAVGSDGMAMEPPNPAEEINGDVKPTPKIEEIGA